MGERHKAAKILRLAISVDTVCMLKIGRFFAFQVKKNKSPIILFKHFCFESAINRDHLSPNQNSNNFQNHKTSDTGL